MKVHEAWLKWWESIGHVARGNRDPARTREAFEAGYVAALEQMRDLAAKSSVDEPAVSRMNSSALPGTPDRDRKDL